MKYMMCLVLLFISQACFSGAYMLANEHTNINNITHPSGYLGQGGILEVSVCIDPMSVDIPQLITPVKNIIFTWNQLIATSPNFSLGVTNDVPANHIDWESVALHELGHCIGLEHPNIGSSGILDENEKNLTHSTKGNDLIFDLDPGDDLIYGTADDRRDDDVNLHWFNKGINNPFVLIPPFDSTQYSRELMDLPENHLFPVNADRTVAFRSGLVRTEAVMQQGTFLDEAQRSLSFDDVATLKLAMSGLDNLAGTEDDYLLRLIYGGVKENCDVNIKHHDISNFAFCRVQGILISNGHAGIAGASIEMGSSRDWHFNQTMKIDVIFTSQFE